VFGRAVTKREAIEMHVTELIPISSKTRLSKSYIKQDSSKHGFSQEHPGNGRNTQLKNSLRRDTKTRVDNRIVIIVGGYRYETLECTLAAFPDTLLGDPTKRDDYYDPISGAFIFFRDPLSFDAILFYYQSKGILAKPMNIEREVFEREVEFFEITSHFDKRHQYEQELLEEQAIEPEMPKACVKKFFWTVFEYPQSSRLASLVGFFSTAMILLSVATLCLETMPALKRPYTEMIVNATGGNKTVRKYGFDHWHAIESFSITWFTFEYIMRLFSAPRFFGFAFSSLGLVDLVAITPYYIALVVQQRSTERNINNSFGIMKLLRLLRIIRVFKLARYNEGLRILMTTIYESSAHLKSLLIVIIIMAVFFATIVFYTEAFLAGASTFCSIPDTLWYTIITMTTVGYGDVYPETAAGRFCGALCGIFGVMLFCLPSPVLVNKFIECYYLRQSVAENESDERKAFVESMKEVYFKGK